MQRVIMKSGTVWSAVLLVTQSLTFRYLYGPRMLSTVFTKPATSPRPKENKSTQHSCSPFPWDSLLLISCLCPCVPRDIDVSGYIYALLISCVLHVHVMLIAVRFGGVLSLKGVCCNDCIGPLATAFLLRADTRIVRHHTCCINANWLYGGW
jgi:hypothetical protein